MSDIMTIREAAEATGISPVAIRSAVARGALETAPASGPGRTKVGVTRASLLAWAAEREARAAIVAKLAEMGPAEEVDVRDAAVMLRRSLGEINRLRRRGIIEIRQRVDGDTEIHYVTAADLLKAARTFRAPYRARGYHDEATVDQGRLGHEDVSQG